MVNPDNLVAANGEHVQVERVTNAVFNEYDELDEEASDTETEDTKAIFSDPSYTEAQNLGGRIESISGKATLPSGIDIDPDREGRADRIIRISDGTRFKAVEKKEDRHPMIGIEKLTVFLETLPGRN